MSPLKFLTISIFVCVLFVTYAAKKIQLEELTGLATRLLHVESIIHTMESQNRIFGMGPSSSFYSQGFGFWTNDSEVSPFEYYRRYGIVGAIAFHSLFFYILLYRLPRANQSPIPLCSFYAISLTNPVMASSFAFFLYFGIEASSRPSKQIAGS